LKNCKQPQIVQATEDWVFTTQSKKEKVISQLTFLLRRPRRNDNDIALPGFFVLSGSHARGRVAVVGCVAEVLDLGVADFGFGVYEEDLAGDLVVLLVALERGRSKGRGKLGAYFSYDQREGNRGSDCACSYDCYAGGGGVGHVSCGFLV
jgi:hypothetical protein